VPKGSGGAGAAGGGARQQDERAPLGPIAAPIGVAQLAEAAKGEGGFHSLEAIGTETNANVIFKVTRTPGADPEVFKPSRREGAGGKDFHQRRQLLRDNLNGDQAFREVAAANIDKLMGGYVASRGRMHVDPVHGRGSLVEFHKEAVNLAKVHQEQGLGALRNSRPFQRQLAQVGVLDYVLQNGDRHLNNIMLNTRTGKVHAIDNGLAMPKNKAYYAGGRAPNSSATAWGLAGGGGSLRTLLPHRSKERIARLASMGEARLARVLERSANRGQGGAAGPQKTFYVGMAKRIIQVDRHVKSGLGMPKGDRNDQNRAVDRASLRTAKQQARLRAIGRPDGPEAKRNARLFPEPRGAGFHVDFGS